jgi:hypothetical protein
VADDALALAPTEPVPARAPRQALDYYPSPRWVVDAIKPYLPRARRVLDPAAGVGELLDAIGADYGIAIELDSERSRQCLSAHHCDEACDGDALAMDWPDADLLIANPPFTLAREFIQRAIQWRLQDPRRTVAILARLTILESEERRAMHQQHPSDVYVLSTRPKFRPGRDGKMATDSVTCCWLVYGPGRGGRWQVL